MQCRGEARWRRLASENIISYQAVSCDVKGSRKVIVDPHPGSDQHRNFITHRGSSTSCPCLPCLVDIRKRVHELSCIHSKWQADRQADRQTTPIQKEVWPPGSADTVCPRSPLMAQVQHFVSRIKKREWWDVYMSLWPWPLTLEVTAIVGHMRLGALWE